MANKTDQKNVLISDYTLYVTNLPKNVTKEEVKSFFEE
jgi:RNA recognition motif-containing protein